MRKLSLIARLPTLAASAAVTLSIVTSLASYALPADTGAQRMAQATPFSAK